MPEKEHINAPLEQRLLSWAHSEETKHSHVAYSGPNPYLVELLREAAGAVSSSTVAPVAWMDPNNHFNLIDAETKARWDKNGWHQDSSRKMSVPLYRAEPSANSLPPAVLAFIRHCVARFEHGPDANPNDGLLHDGREILSSYVKDGNS